MVRGQRRPRLFPGGRAPAPACSPCTSAHPAVAPFAGPGWRPSAGVRRGGERRGKAEHPGPACGSRRSRPRWVSSHRRAGVVPDGERQGMPGPRHAARCRPLWLIPHCPSCAAGCAAPTACRNRVSPEEEDRSGPGQGQAAAREGRREHRCSPGELCALGTPHRPAMQAFHLVDRRRRC